VPRGNNVDIIAETFISLGQLEPVRTPANLYYPALSRSHRIALANISYWIIQLPVSDVYVLSQCCPL